MNSYTIIAAVQFEAFDRRPLSQFRSVMLIFVYVSDSGEMPADEMMQYPVKEEPRRGYVDESEADAQQQQQQQPNSVNGNNGDNGREDVDQS